MSQDGSDISGCPGRPPHRQLRLSKSSGSSLGGASKPVLSAKDLTGAPLISLVPCKTRKVRPGPGPTSRKYYERQRHSSEQGNIPSSYYAGQHLYQKLLVDQGYPYLQDFYQNPTFGSRSNPRQAGREESSRQQSLVNMRRDKRHLTTSKSYDNLSDTLSVTSEESDNFKPRIIRPRRRRKKEKRLRVSQVSLTVAEQEEEGCSASCLGSENQWLPTGLLSAESDPDPDTRSDTATSDEEVEESMSSKRRGHRKLGGTLSVPTYSYQLREGYSQETTIGSDYYSLTSSSSCSPNSPQSSSSDQLCDSDNGMPGQHPSLTSSRSYNQYSNSYFRSPKLTQKVETEKKAPVKSRQLPLRKTQSWALGSSNNNKLGEFSLFSPGKSIDLLSGIRKHLSRLDLNEEDTNVT